MEVDKQHFLPHCREARQRECADGHHHVADSNIEVAGQGEIQRDENQPCRTRNVTLAGHVTFLALATLYTEMVKSASTTSVMAPAPEAGEQSDEGIVQAVLDGNTALFELLMRRYNERLYRTARAITRDDREAEDVMQQAYVNAYANLRQFRGQAQFATWLTRIAINEALARVRRRGRYEPFDDDPMNADTMEPIRSSPDPERQAFAGELRELLEWAIDTLPGGAREVFVLRDVEGLSTADTAASLGVSEDVVKTRLSRARSALRRTLLERAGATAPDAFRFYRPRCDRLVSLVLAQIADGSATMSGHDDASNVEIVPGDPGDRAGDGVSRRSTSGD